jgi:hypothetical protein
VLQSEEGAAVSRSQSRPAAVSHAHTPRTHTQQWLRTCTHTASHARQQPWLQVDEDGSKEIDFGEFMHAIMMNKTMTATAVNEEEVLDAFCALGGNVRGISGVSRGLQHLHRVSTIQPKPLLACMESTRRRVLVPNCSPPQKLQAI